jgi:predicted O-methyltransferase YrrM
MQLVFPDDCFPNLMTIDRSTVKDPTVRHEIPHNILADRRIPHIAFANRDEAHIIFNTALLFAGKPGLAIGCFLGWSTCHLALGGVRLDAVDPLLDRPDIRRNVEASLAAAKVLDRVNLVAGESPEMVRRLASSGDRRWSLVLIEGKRATPGLPKNAEICLAHCATDALVLITDLVSPVAWEEFDHFRQAGWQTRIYDTAQIMGVAWRGAVRPIDHRPDPEVTWSRPGHMRDAQETRGHQVAPDSIATSGMKLSPRIDFAAARSIMQQAAIFVPNSAGDIAATFGQTMLGVGQTLPALATLADVIGHAAVPIIDIGALERTPAAIQATDELGRLFRHHGSDKSTVHDYHLLYGALLADPTQVKAVLEIGLGMNNVAVVSNMGTTGRPGASLRAFRDWLPDAQIFGADVDRGILFEEPRIRTFFVDQTSPKTLIQLGDVIGLSFDLVIDDGLHTPNANLNTLAFALPRIRPGGWVVIEDIPERALDIWRIVSSLLPPGYRPQLIRARGGYLFVLRRPLSTPT